MINEIQWGERDGRRGNSTFAALLIFKRKNYRAKATKYYGHTAH